jgi:hypothetical protein
MRVIEEIRLGGWTRVNAARVRVRAKDALHARSVGLVLVFVVVTARCVPV